MKTIINNVYEVKEEEVTEIVKRVKILMLNSKNQILLGYSDEIYQFPGGHVEENESLEEAINREILEETGIELAISNPTYFAKADSYYKDWPVEGQNRKTEIMYYEVFTDLEPNVTKTNYTDAEKEGNFELRYIDFSNVEEVISNNANKYGNKKGIATEMIEIIKIYKEQKLNQQ